MKMGYQIHLTKGNIIRAILIFSPAVVPFIFNRISFSGYSVSNAALIVVLALLGSATYLYQAEKTNRALADAAEKFDYLKVRDGELIAEDEAGNETTLV